MLLMDLQEKVAPHDDALAMLERAVFLESGLAEVHDTLASLKQHLYSICGYLYGMSVKDMHLVVHSMD